jgi:hypothetical protein
MHYRFETVQRQGFTFIVSHPKWKTRYEVGREDMFANTKPVDSHQISCGEYTRAYIYFLCAFSTKSGKNAPIRVAMSVCPSLCPHVGETPREQLNRFVVTFLF